MEIDFSQIQQPTGANIDENWEPPQHKFFGKKLENGKMEKEPVYVHQAYPAYKYALIDGKIIAKQVNSKVEHDALGDEWSDTPADFGYIGAPTFEQSQIPAEAPKKRGRPALDKAA